MDILRAVGRLSGPTPPSALARLRESIASGEGGLAPALRSSLIERVDDVQRLIAESGRSLAVNDSNATSSAARLLAQCALVTGHPMRRWLAGEVVPSSLVRAIETATTEDATPARALVADRLGPASEPVCAVCRRTDALIRCGTCERTYCDSHAVRTEVWSGSWLESVLAYCPLGHETEIG